VLDYPLREISNQATDPKLTVFEILQIAHKPLFDTDAIDVLDALLIVEF